MTITADQLRNAPTSEYMNEAQRAYFRDLLANMRAEVAGRLSTSPVSLDDINSTPDPLDRATMEEERGAQLAERKRNADQLAMIDAALKRIEANEYGYCEDTGDEIGIGRLMAVPCTTLSKDAAERRSIQAKQWRAAA